MHTFTGIAKHMRTCKVLRPQIIRLLATQTSVNIKTQYDDSEISKARIDPEWETALPFENIPGPSKLGLLRRFSPGGKYYKKTMVEFTTLCREEYGDFALLPGTLGKRDIVLTYNPKDFRKIYRTEGIWPNRPGLDTMVYYRKKKRADFFQGTSGLITTQGEEWARFRSAVNPVMMQPKTVRLYVSKMDKVATEFLERIKEIRDPKTKEVPDNFEEEINRWTLESVGVVALDEQLGLIRSKRDNPDAIKLFDSLNTFFELVFELDIKPSFWKIFPTPNFIRLMNAFDNINDICKNYIDASLERLQNNPDLTKPDSERSVLEKLLKIDKKIAIVMALDMLFAGVDTTTTIFVGIMVALAKNPEKQEKLRNELMTVLPEKDTPLTIEAMKSLPYLRACIKEGMRVYPLTLGNMRSTGQNVVLSGYRVPQGVDMLMPTGELFKVDDHFPSAAEFMPERWLRNHGGNECPSAKNADPFIFLPFGFGPRMCIGKRFVEQELEMGLSRIFRNFSVEFNYSVENIFKNYIINVPNKPLKFKFEDI